MKKLLMMACLAAFVLTGCNDGKNNAANSAAQADSLNSIIAQKDSELNDMLGTLNARQYDDELTARFRLLEVGDHLGKASTHTFLVQLRDFTATAHLSVLSKDLGKLLQGLHHSIG